MLNNRVGCPAPFCPLAQAILILCPLLSSFCGHMFVHSCLCSDQHHDEANGGGHELDATGNGFAPNANLGYCVVEVGSYRVSSDSGCIPTNEGIEFSLLVLR